MNEADACLPIVGYRHPFGVPGILLSAFLGLAPQATCLGSFGARTHVDTDDRRSRSEA